MALTKEDIQKWAKRKGWTQDRFGNLKKKHFSGHYRIKLKPLCVRLEVQVVHSNGVIPSSWVMVQRGIYRNLSISPEGRLLGLYPTTRGGRR